jgi:hypothetical protein
VPGHLPESDCKQELSRVYAHALAISIGVKYEIPADLNSCDVQFRAKDTDDDDAASLAVQLKCTSSQVRRLRGGREISFPLEKHDYDNLRKSKPHPPRLLVVVEIPYRLSAESVRAAPHRLLVEASAWYASLKGAPALPSGQKHKSVRIPIGQRFDSRALRENMSSCQ